MAFERLIVFSISASIHVCVFTKQKKFGLAEILTDSGEGQNLLCREDLMRCDAEELEVL